MSFSLKLSAEKRHVLAEERREQSGGESRGQTPHHGIDCRSSMEMATKHLPFGYLT